MTRPTVEEQLRLVSRARDNMRARMVELEKRLGAALGRCRCDRAATCEACQLDRDFLGLPRIPDPPDEDPT